MLRAGLMLAFLAACQEYPFVYRPNQRVALTTMREVIVRNTNTDVLFIIDNSGSMTEEQANLKRNTAVFITTLAQSENIYRVGIITTDARDEAAPGENGGRLRLVHATSAELSAAGCGIGEDTSPEPYLVRPDPLDPQATEKRCRLVEDFKKTIDAVGVNPNHFFEAGLAATCQALASAGAADCSAVTAGSVPCACTDAVAAANSGFLRPDADLAVIALTDEDDCTFADFTGMTPVQCYQEAASALPVASFVTFLAGLKGGTSGVRRVRAALIAGGVWAGEGNADFVPRGCRLDTVLSAASADCGCWTATDSDGYCTHLQRFGHACPSTLDCTSTNTCKATLTSATCDTTRCDALPGLRMHQLITDLRARRQQYGFSGGTYEDSICQPEYDQTLLTIARTVVLTSCFTLDEPALSAGWVRVVHRHTDTITGAVSERELMRYDPLDPSAPCQDCANCDGRAWAYVDAQNFCLECGLKKETGDEFLITVVNDVYGVDGGPQ